MFTLVQPEAPYVVAEHSAGEYDFRERAHIMELRKQRIYNMVDELRNRTSPAYYEIVFDDCVHLITQGGGDWTILQNIERHLRNVLTGLDDQDQAAMYADLRRG